MKLSLRKYRIIVALLAAVMIVPQTLTGQTGQNRAKDPVIEKIILEGTTHNQTMDHLDILCNRFGGRILGSAAYTDAAEWAAYMFKKWGLEVIMEEVGELPVGFNRGPWFGRMLGGKEMTLHFVTPSYTAGTKGVQRGTVVKEPQTREEFERMKGTIKGAWVLINGSNTGWPIDYSPAGDQRRAEIIARNEEIAKENNEIRAYNRDIQRQKAALQKEIENNPKTKAANTAKIAALEEKPYKPLVEEPALFYKEMKEAGMLGIIQSSPVPLRALYDRKNLENMTWETLPTIPDIKLDEDQYKIIADMVAKREYFQLEFDIRNHFRMGPVKFHNVIGMIRGTEYPDQYVMCGGHLDSFDVATGGVDCGVGTTPAMEAARLIAQAGGKPKRTLLFCLWAGEEFGLWGSRFWTENNSEKLPNISNYFNRDGGPTVPLGITVTPEMYDDFVAVCEPVNSINKDFPFTVQKRTGEPRPIPTGGGSSDDFSFATFGVPTFGFNTGDPKGYNFDYGEIWHTDRDLYNKSIPEYQNHASVVTAVVMYGLGNLDHLLDRANLYKAPASPSGKAKK